MNLFNAVRDNMDEFLSNPEIEDADKISRLKNELEQLRFHMQYMDNPREKYQNYLLQAKQVDVANVDGYIIEEINRMKSELDR